MSSILPGSGSNYVPTPGKEQQPSYHHGQAPKGHRGIEAGQKGLESGKKLDELSKSLDKNGLTDDNIKTFIKGLGETLANITNDKDAEKAAKLMAKIRNKQTGKLITEKFEKKVKTAYEKANGIFHKAEDKGKVQVPIDAAKDVLLTKYEKILRASYSPEPPPLKAAGDSGSSPPPLKPRK